MNFAVYLTLLVETPVFGRPKAYQESLTKTRHSFFGRIASLFRQDKVTEETWEELEMLLLQADVGAKTTIRLVEALRARVGTKTTASQVQETLKTELLTILAAVQRPYLPGERLLNVVFVVGVNGSGKTTSIAKLAKYHRDRGQKVVLAAADTFRAAAIDQIKVWGERVGVEVISHQPGADPGAVVFDAIGACQSRHADVLIIDTAGRLHTKYNLMQELRKLRSVAQKQVHLAPHETLLVIDATTGQNGLSQAAAFTEAVAVSGVVLAKLDSSAKGGIVFAIAVESKLPVLFVATGEKLDDWSEFDPEAFVDGLFETKG
jgi:fused signal recognition particle receptor